MGYILCVQSFRELRNDNWRVPETAQERITKISISGQCTDIENGGRQQSITTVMEERYQREQQQPQKR